MAEILLLEPNYNNKYPPLGLMKISYYHKEHKGDYVRFAKGNLPENFRNKKWDRIYVTTLFTFEWEETKKAINYALQVAKDPTCIFIGGIAATLMPERIAKEFITYPLNIVPGLLDEKGKLGFNDDDIIDTITPDYSILNDIKEQYKYPAENAYFTYTTRGCGMKCGFCAVQKLEPNYIPYIDIKKQVETIITKYGEKKDLLLMDNNVLKSPKFNQIIDDIKELGFAKGAKYKSPVSGKFVQRFVDFNQGLDAFLLTEEKAAKMAEIAIKPARIAFDHFEDNVTEAYKTAITLCAKYGITELSNYILYNSDAFSGKGHSYKADIPEDLYNRLRLTLDLKEEINCGLEDDKKIAIFSFPMRYIPLQDDKRGYVGEKWNVKYLRAIQRMLIPTQGKGVSSKSFFEADFGVNCEEYMEVLAMPEDIIATRGRFEEKKEETKEQREKRKQQWEENNQIRDEWKRLFKCIEHKGKRENFNEIISMNIFNSEKFLAITDPFMQKAFLHYFSDSQFLSTLNELTSDKAINLIYDYCVNEFPIYINKIVRYIYDGNIPYSKIIGFVKVFRTYGIKLILQKWVDDNYSNDSVLYLIERAQLRTKLNIINFTLLKTFKSYVDFKCIDHKTLKQAEKYIVDIDNAAIVEMLKKNSKKFKKALTESIKDSIGQKELTNQIDILTDQLFKELSIY